MVAVRANPDGALLSALDSFDVTIDTDLDSLNGTTIGANSGVANAGTLRVTQALDISSSVQIQGIARTTNPAAVADAADVRASFDKLGRMLTVPYQIRELVSTARVVLTGGAGGNTETTLLASGAGAFSDLFQITAVNTSTATLGSGTSVQLDIRSETGAGVVHSMMINDDDMRVITFNPPLPQNTAAATWTVQTPNDISTGTAIIVSATFVQNT